MRESLSDLARVWLPLWPLEPRGWAAFGWCLFLGPLGVSRVLGWPWAVTWMGIGGLIWFLVPESLPLAIAMPWLFAALLAPLDVRA